MASAGLHPGRKRFHPGWCQQEGATPLRAVSTKRVSSKMHSGSSACRSRRCKQHQFHPSPACFRSPEAVSAWCDGEGWHPPRPKEGARWRKVRSRLEWISTTLSRTPTPPGTRNRNRHHEAKVEEQVRRDVMRGDQHDRDVVAGLRDEGKGAGSAARGSGARRPRRFLGHERQ